MTATCVAIRTKVLNTTFEVPNKRQRTTDGQKERETELLWIPEDMLVSMLQYLRAKDMANCELLCSMFKTRVAKSSSLTLVEHAAMMRCRTNGWSRLTSANGWKQTLNEQRVWIVVDTSASMGEMFRDRDTKRTVSRLDIAIKHLKEHVLPGLKPEQEFNLVRFSRSVEAEGPVPASADNIKAAMAKLDEWSPDGSTEIYSALHEAYNDPKMKEVYLISDGDARDHTELISATRRWCRLRTEDAANENENENENNETQSDDSDSDDDARWLSTHNSSNSSSSNGSSTSSNSSTSSCSSGGSTSGSSSGGSSNGSSSSSGRGLRDKPELSPPRSKPDKKRVPCNTVCVFSDGRSKELMNKLSDISCGKFTNYTADHETYSRVY